MVAGDAAFGAALRRGTLEFCVLALLRDAELYGVELTRRLAGVDGLATSEGTLYPLLSRLRRDGLVTTTWRESPAGPPRRYYALSDEGRGSLDRFAAEWKRYRDAVDEILETR